MDVSIKKFLNKNSSTILHRAFSNKAYDVMLRSLSINFAYILKLIVSNQAILFDIFCFCLIYSGFHVIS